jgi:hypothetical protein
VADALRLLVLLALGAGGLTALAALLGWWFEGSRRLKRIVRDVLKTQPDVQAVDAPEGRAAGLSVEARAIAVVWERGAQALLYGFEELEGAELIIDGHVEARVARGEPKRLLDTAGRDAEQVTLRMMFADARFPEFELDLWGPQSAFRTRGGAASDAVRAGRRWLAHADAVVRRPRAEVPAPSSVGETAI